MKKILVIGFLFLVVPVAYAKASVALTEVMYDPPGTDDKHEWVEVVNTGSASIDLTKYFLQTDGTGTTYHAITAGGSALVPAGSYAVIVQDVATFLSDHAGFGGLVFDSSWTSLSDSSGKTLVINDANKTPLDQYTYDPSIGANNDGNSLQKNSSGVWIAGTPTPGSVNTDTAAGAEDTTNSTETDTQTNSDQVSGTPGMDGIAASDSSLAPSASSTPQSLTVPQAFLLIPKIATAGVAIDIVPSLSGVKNISSNPKTFHISFGDGAEHNDMFLESVRHTYTYPGTYNVTFTYQQNPYDNSTAGDLSVRKTIEVVAASAVIDSINPDGSIKISNPSSREIDLSGWMIDSAIHPASYFIVPAGTIILPGKAITIPKDFTKFTDTEEASLALSLPSGPTASVYTKQITNAVTTQQVVLAMSATSHSAKTTLVKKKKAPVKKSSAQANVVASNYANTLSQKDIGSIDSTDNNPLEAQVVPSGEKSLGSLRFSTIDIVVGVCLLVFLVGAAGFVIFKKYFIKNSSELDSIPRISIEEISDNSDEIRIIEE